MIINEWEIWHTYSTYIQVPAVDLDYAARRLVEAGFFKFAMLRSGRAYWKNDTNLCSGITNVKLNAQGNECTADYNISKKDGCSLRGFKQEAWYQAVHFRFNELRLFGEDSSLPPSYIRGFVGEIRMMQSPEDEEGISCYPVVVIYETGVIIIEFRVISPSDSVSLKDFISFYVNLSRHSFSSFKVPPAIAKHAFCAYYFKLKKYSFINRLRLVRLQRLNERIVDKEAICYSSGDFTFCLSPLSFSNDKGVHNRLNTLALSFFDTVTYLLSNQRTGINLLLFGQRDIFDVSTYWTGRPHVHVLKFSDQKKRAKDNEYDYGAAWGSILANTYISDRKHACTYLPEDKRSFSDYSMYITSSATLMVWSLDGLLQQKEWANVNRGHLIYEPQIIVELLEYGYMLHHRLLNSIDEYSESHEVLFARKNLLELEHNMEMAGRFGEIRELLVYGWKTMGVDSLQKRIEQALLIRESVTRLKEASSAEEVGKGITIIFGFASTASFSTYILEPLWKFLDLPIISGNNPAFQTMLNCISLSVVSLILACILKNITRYKTEKIKITQ